MHTPAPLVAAPFPAGLFLELIVPTEQPIIAMVPVGASPKPLSGWPSIGLRTHHHEAPPGWHRHDDSHLKAPARVGLLLCTQVAYFASHVRPLQHHNRARSASAPVPAPRAAAQPPAALQPRTDPGRARGPAARRRARASYAALGAGSLLVAGAWILGNRQAIRFASSSGLSIQATDQSPASARSRHTTLPG